MSSSLFFKEGNFSAKLASLCIPCNLSFLLKAIFLGNRKWCEAFFQPLPLQGPQGDRFATIFSSFFQDNRSGRVSSQSQLAPHRHQYSLESAVGISRVVPLHGCLGNRISYDWDYISFLLSPYFCSLDPWPTLQCWYQDCCSASILVAICVTPWNLGSEQTGCRHRSVECVVVRGVSGIALHGPCDHPDVSYVLDARVTSERGCLAEPSSSQPTPCVMPSTSSMSLDSRCNCHGKLRALIQTSTRTERELQRRSVCRYHQ